LTTISWKYKPPSRSKGYIIEEISWTNVMKIQQ
jgi:hypothetical protein